METTLCTVALADPPAMSPDPVVLPDEVCLALLRTAGEIHRAGLKSFGLFVADPTLPGYPYRPTGVVFLDPYRNRRNDPLHRGAFRAQGEYFRQYDDAGFVADPADLLRVYREIDDAGLEIVGMFHSHRRQPPNFSVIDYRLHNPAFPWHLILSYHRGDLPQLRPFGIHKTEFDLGISEHDHGQDSQCSYRGPEVRPLGLVVAGPPGAVGACAAQVDAQIDDGI
jgi:proteasome lid subunit RPN8/RPN11